MGWELMQVVCVQEDPPPHSPALSLGLPPAPGHVNPQQVPRDHGLSRLQESER